MTVENLTFALAFEKQDAAGALGRFVGKGGQRKKTQNEGKNSHG